MNIKLLHIICYGLDEMIDDNKISTYSDNDRETLI